MKSKVRTLKKPRASIKQVEKLAKELHAAGSVKVGLPKGSNAYPDGTSVIEVGVLHEFGSAAKNVPQRSFLRATVEQNQQNYKRLFKRLGRELVRGETTELKALKVVGQRVEGDVKSRISDGVGPALKGRDGTPLIDTGHLRQSIRYQVFQ